MILDVANRGIAIRGLLAQPGARRHRLADLLEQPAGPLSLQEFSAHWGYIVIEPERLLAFFNEQAPAVGGAVPGPEWVHIADEPETSSDMAVRAARQLLQNYPGASDAIGALIYYHATLPQEPAHSTACRLQYELALKNAFAFSLSQKGAGAGVQALQAACELLVSEPDLEAVLLAGSDKFVPPYCRLVPGLAMVGDSASAMLVTRGDGWLQPLFFEVLDIPDGGADPLVRGRRPRRPVRDEGILRAEERVPGDPRGPGGPPHELVRRMAARMNVAPGEFTLLMPNLRLDVLRCISAEAGVPWSRVYSANVGRMGCLGNSDLAANLLAARSEGVLQDGAAVIALQFGFGESTACIGLRCGPVARTAPTPPQRTVGMAHFAYHLPPDPVSVEDFGRNAGLSAEAVQRYRDIHGIHRVHAARQDSARGLAVKAVQNLLHSSEIDPHSIGAVIFHHTFYLLSVEPRTLLGQIRQELGLDRATGFAVAGQNCASIIGALRLARNMILSGSAEHVLLVSADCFLGSSKRVIEDATIQGDAASAALVSHESARGRILGIWNWVDGSFYRGVAASGENDRFQLVYYLRLHRLIQHSLRQLGLTLDDIRLIVPHNINRSSWDKVLERLRCGPAKLFAANIERVGHVCSADLVVNLADVAAQGSLNSGDLVLLVTVGLGAGWGCAILRW
jgi:3-oxoacyl-[acyl-carrier-protein] synthase III